jgi:DNA end-binding protein Ku
MSRVLWKGAISFGLVHVPVALYPASQESSIDFDWLDKRSIDPVGYLRVNKRTGKEIKSEDIVKGIKQDNGDYVVLSDEQIKAAYPKTTQTIEIEAFVQASDIAFTLLETPYYLEPIAKGEKVYTLLREAMQDAGVIGIARVVLRTKAHLAALIPSGNALILNTLRWANEVRPLDDLKLPAAGKTAFDLKPAELKMAAQLIGSMTVPFNSADYADQFTTSIQDLVKRKVAAGEAEQVGALEEVNSPDAATSNVVDLTELLASSLAKRKPASSDKPGHTGPSVAAKREAGADKAKSKKPAKRQEKRCSCPAACWPHRWSRRRAS